MENGKQQLDIWIQMSRIVPFWHKCHFGTYPTISLILKSTFCRTVTRSLYTGLVYPNSISHYHFPHFDGLPENPNPWRTLHHKLLSLGYLRSILSHTWERSGPRRDRDGGCWRDDDGSRTRKCRQVSSLGGPALHPSPVAPRGRADYNENPPSSYRQFFPYLDNKSYQAAY